MRYFLPSLLLLSLGCPGEQPASGPSQVLATQLQQQEAEDREANARTLARYEAECEQGEQESCYWVGTAWEHGHGGQTVNLDRAREIYEQACAVQVALACNDLGTMYGEGRGVAKDEAEAARLYTLACELGDGVGCANLAAFYLDGMGVERDPVKARALYETGCELKSSLACRDLGHLHANGEPPDYEAARSVWKKSCDDGFGQSCADLGFLYVQGLGVPQDKARGEELMRQGCALGYDHVCQFVR